MSQVRDRSHSISAPKEPETNASMKDISSPPSISLKGANQVGLWHKKKTQPVKSTLELSEDAPASAFPFKEGKGSNREYFRRLEAPRLQRRLRGSLKCELQGVSETIFSVSALFSEAAQNMDDSTICLIEDALLAVMQLVRARDLTDVVVASVTFIKSRTQTSMTKMAIEQLGGFIESLFPQTQNLQSESENEEWDSIRRVNDFREFLRRWKDIKECTLAKKYSRLVKYLIGFGILAKVGVTVSKETHKICVSVANEPFASVDFLHELVDLVSMTLQRALMFAKTKRWEVFIHGPGSYAQWYDKCFRLKRESLCVSNLEVHGTTYFKFVAELKEVIEQGKAIVRFGDLAVGTEQLACKRLLHDMQLIEAQVITTKSAQKERQAPFAVMVYGGSGVAKSHFVKMLFYYYAQIMKLPAGSEYKYTRNAADEYWSGFTSQKWCIHLDDIGLLNVDKAMEDRSIIELIQLINNVPFVPNQAALEDKGRTPCRAKFVIATGNVKDLNAPAYFHCPLAVQRRIPFIFTLTPKKEYVYTGPDGNPILNDSGMLMIDPARIPKLSDTWPDIWDIQVDRVVPGGMIANDRVLAKFEPVRRFSNIQLFLDWFKTICVTFQEVQAKAMLDDDVMANFTVCEECNRTVCECRQLQSGATHVLPSGVEWGDPFTHVECEGELIFQDIFEFHQHSSTYMKTSVVLKGDQLLRQSTCPVNVVLSPKKMEEVTRAQYADVLSEVLRIAAQRETNVVDRAFSGVIVWGVSKYASSPTVRTVANWFLDSSWCRLVCAWLINLYLKDGFTREAILFMGEIARRSYANRQQIFIIGSIGILCSAILACTLFSGKASTVKPDEEEKVSVVSNVVSSFAVATELGNSSEEKQPGSDELGPQGMRQAVDDSHFKKTEKFNVWQKEDYQTTTFDVDPVHSNFASLPWDQVSSILRRNCARITTKIVGDETQRFPGNAFCLRGHLWVMNDHLLPEDGDLELLMEFEPNVRGVNQNIKILLRQKDILRKPDADLAFFEVLSMAPRRDLTKLIAKDTFDGRYRAHYVGFHRDLSIKDDLVCAVQKTRDYCYPLEKEFVYWTGSVQKDTVNGDCGTILVMHNPHCVILGLHQLGGARQQVFSVALTQSRVEEALKHFDRVHIEPSAPVLQAPSAPKSLGPVRHRSPLRWLQKGHLKVYGSFAGFTPAPRSRVCSTLLGKQILADRKWDLSVAAPDLGDYRAWHHAYNDIMGQQYGLIDRTTLKQATDGYVSDVIAGLSREDLDSIQALSEDAAVRGITGVQFIDKMNFNSSMGEPYCKSKRHFISLEDPERLDSAKFDEEVRELMRVIREKYSQGKRASPVFSGQIKDEPRPLKKIAQGMNRLFTGASAAWSVVVREQLLTFVAVMMKNPLLFEGAPGCVVQSLEWEKFRDYLTKFGEERCIAGDYGKYDKRMPAEVILEAVRAIVEILKAAGYTDEECLPIWAFGYDIAYPVVNMGGDLVEFSGSNPSGHPLTVIINCIANSIYMRYCYVELNPAKECKSFKSNVALLTYGDDNAAGVSACVPWFNHTAVSKVLGDIGIVYTMADKEAESVPYIHINEVSFLKRTWRWDEDVGAYVAPIEEDSIKKMLCVAVRSKTLSPESHQAAVMVSAANEWFFYGREVFEKERAWLLETAVRGGILHEVNAYGMPTWDQLYERFWKASKDIDPERACAALGVDDSSCA